jgi:pyruvate dehydrogenase E2 component (dihydrolipoamide acetyltransferase)
MGGVTITLPRLGETMETARVLDWRVAPGRSFARGEVLLEVETDKTVVEVPALTAGVLLTQLVAPGETVALDQPIAEMEAATAVAAPVDAAPPAADAPAATPEPSAPVPADTVPSAEAFARAGPRLAASPKARALARAAGVDLAALQGSGRRGRIMGIDVTPDGPLPRPANSAGRPIALLHGLFDSPRGWRDLPRRLQARGHPVLVPDLPAIDPGEGLDAMAGRLVPLLPAGPLGLIGHSLGAAVAVRLALRLGPAVERLVLIAPAGIGARLNADFADGMLHAETPAALARALALLEAGPVSEAALAAELDRLRGLRPTHAVLAAALVRGGIQQIDITADLARLAVPVAVVFGTADRILDWRDVAHLPPEVAIHLVRGAGHLPHLAAPDLIVGLATDRPLSERSRAHA